MLTNYYYLQDNPFHVSKYTMNIDDVIVGISKYSQE